MTTQLKNSQTFRVFFSSPFKGMEEEREELTRKYFPEIQHKCAEMGLQFVAVDMRWGISYESAQAAQTINICFKEIDRSDMFVNLFGQRYGWQGHTDPLLQDNIKNALGRYPWLDDFRDRSVTELEVCHGFLNNPGDIPAVICFRDKKYDHIMKDLMKDKVANFSAENELCTQKLTELKKRVLELQSKAVAVHLDYPNPHEGARLIYKAIVSYLDENVLKQSGDLPRREKDLALHKAFAASRTSLYIRNEELSDFLNSALKSCRSDSEEGEKTCPCVVVTGPAGCGKSSLLCDWLHSHVSQLPRVIAIPYYIGCAPSTRDPEGLVDFVYGELEHYLEAATHAKDGAEHQADNNSNNATNTGSGDQGQKNISLDGNGAQTDHKHTDQHAGGITDSNKDKAKAKGENRPKGKELQHQVMVKLKKLVESGYTVVLVFDAINRLVPANKTSKTLYWLPEKLCDGVVCVVSTEVTDHASLTVLQKERDFQVLRLGPLDESVQREICIQTLKHSGKELSPAQLDRIIKAKQAENPLFLKIVLAELSIFGYFRKLDEKIDSLICHSSIKELLLNCLERLEADYNEVAYEGNLVGEILKALFVSHQGLTESEICSIFKIPSNVWSPIYFAMEFFIVSHLGNLGFAFTEIREAVKDRYFPDSAAVSQARKVLISYFDGIRKQLQPWMKSKALSEKPVEHAVVELVWLQRKEEDRKAVANTLTDLAVFRIMNDGHELDLLELWQWTGLRWSEVCSGLLKALDCAIVNCYLATERGELDGESSPGVRMRVAVSHLRSFFDLANFVNGSEKVLEREIRILENAEGKMDEGLRKELLRDASYYLACTYASQDRYKEAKALHETNMAEFEKALAEKDDEELKKQIAYTHNGLGILCMNAEEYEKSIEHFTKSAEFHHGKKDRKNEAAAYTNMALVYMYRQEFLKALEYNNKALEAYEDGLFGQLSMDIGNVYTNIGLVHRRMKNLKKAEEAYLKSLEIKVNAVGRDHLVIATAYMNLGTLEMHRRDYTRAEEWTRKAIGVYQANELAVTKKEYRRCRENLFANMLKQDKFEEVMPLYIEIFDILHQNGWIDECLGGMHRQMVTYMIDNKPDLRDKAEEISMALIDSNKAHPQNYGHLVALDMDLPKDQRPQRPYKYSLDACMKKFPTHSMYDTIVELNMDYFLLPEEDREGIRALLTHVVANYTDSNFESIIMKVTTVAQDLEKEDLLFQCLRSLLEEDPTNVRAVQLFVRLSVHLERPVEALPFIDPFLDKWKDKDGKFVAENIRPARTRLDVAKVLIARGWTGQARQLLLLVTAKSSDAEQREEAKAVLDSLPGMEEDEVEAAVTSAA